MSLRDQILGASDLPKQEVPCPEWGCTVYVRSMSGAERDWFEAQVTQINDLPASAPRNIRALLVALTAVDADGMRIFSEADVDALGKKSAAVLDRLWRASLELNRIGSDELEQAKGN